MTTLRALWVAAALLVPCAAAALEIAQVVASSHAFRPAEGEQISLRFHVSKAATVMVNVYDGRELLVRRIRADLDAGEHAVTWDGRDDQGRLLPDEAYHYTLAATGEDDHSVVHDLTDLTGGERLRVEDVAWDAESGVLSYRLPRPARVNVRLGLVNHGPLLRTLVDWVPRPAGVNREVWDGFDASAVLDLARHPNLDVAVEAYALSDNTVFLGTPPVAIAFAAIDEPAERRQPTQVPRKRMYEHSQQPLDARGDVAIVLSLPADTPKDVDGAYLVSGRVPVRLDVAAHDRQRVLDRRFEPVFFVDGTFVFENEVGFLPTTWIWDTTRYPVGEHFVTANLRGYEGNFGMATVRVRVVEGTE
ncbi:MAG TPA: FlgD immunoglobulin-like domain containing protein [Xanthomonadaceae bacterium]|nr:FlgD immunoglobulin-like domain containing protein [Xanthomonadaceae bacterium]